MSRKSFFWEQTKGFLQYEVSGFVSEYEILSEENGPVLVHQGSVSLADNFKSSQG